jgi:hypothetical protein
MLRLHHPTAAAKPTTIEDLQQQFPRATPAECRRFHAACPKDAVEKIRAYLHWRERHQLDEAAVVVRSEEEEGVTAAEEGSNKDAMDWKRAVHKAMTVYGPKESAPDAAKKRVFGRRQPISAVTVTTSTSTSTSIPNTSTSTGIIHVPQPILAPTLPTTTATIRDLQGHMVLLHLPARIDLHLASNEVYAQAMAIYIDSHLDRHTEDKLTLLVDVRPSGSSSTSSSSSSSSPSCSNSNSKSSSNCWSNPPAASLLGFIRHVAHALHDLNPHRLAHCVLYPIPRAGVYLWAMVQAFLDPAIRELVVVVSGSAAAGSDIPTRVQEFMNAETLVAVHAARTAALEEGLKPYT